MTATATRTGKISGIRLAKQQLRTCNTLCCNFPWRLCTTTTWKCLFSRLVEDVNSRLLSVSFPEVRDSPLEFNSRKICQHLPKWTRWNRYHKFGRRANSLFKWLLPLGYRTKRNLLKTSSPPIQTIAGLHRKLGHNFSSKTAPSFNSTQYRPSLSRNI